jgi:SOS-response transcriptional repressor LexA
MLRKSTPSIECDGVNSDGGVMVDMALAAEGEARRSEILKFIETYSREHGWAPSGAEIAAAIGVSATAVSKHIRRLEAEGRLVRAGRLARGLHVVNQQANANQTVSS